MANREIRTREKNEREKDRKDRIVEKRDRKENE